MKDKTGKELSASEVMRKIIMRLYSIVVEFVIMILHIVGYIPSHTIRKIFYKLAGIKIGKGSTIHMGARFYDNRISIGKDTIIGESVVLDGRDTIIIGDHVDIASEVMIYNAEHNVHSAHFESITGSVIIEDYAFIGPRVIIMPGVTIKKGGVVAAGAVVTKDVEEYSIVAGIPARPIGERKTKELNYILGRARWFR